MIKFFKKIISRNKSEDNELIEVIPNGQLSLSECAELEHLISTYKAEYQELSHKKNYHPYMNLYSRVIYDDFKLFLAIKNSQYKARNFYVYP